MKKIQIPELVDGNKSPTLNGTGYIFYTISPVGKVFIEDECSAGKVVFEVGAGFSNISIEALKAGVHKYTANDISNEHLRILAQRVEEGAGKDALRDLNLHHGKAPSDLPKVEQHYDAILADKVMHFMPPAAINEFIKWSKKALKPNGKIYVTVASPYSKLYTKMLSEYLSNLKNRAEFPGHFTDMMNTIDLTVSQNYAKYTIPSAMVLFSRQDLIATFQRHGMQIVNSYSLQIPTTDEAEWKIVPDEQSNIVGVVAQVMDC